MNGYTTSALSAAQRAFIINCHCLLILIVSRATVYRWPRYYKSSEFQFCSHGLSVYVVTALPLPLASLSLCRLVWHQVFAVATLWRTLTRLLASFHALLLPMCLFLSFFLLFFCFFSSPSMGSCWYMRRLLCQCTKQFACALDSHSCTSFCARTRALSFYRAHTASVIVRTTYIIHIFASAPLLSLSHACPPLAHRGAKNSLSFQARAKLVARNGAMKRLTDGLGAPRARSICTLTSNSLVYHCPLLASLCSARIDPGHTDTYARRGVCPRSSDAQQKDSCIPRHGSRPRRIPVRYVAREPGAPTVPTDAVDSGRKQRSPLPRRYEWGVSGACRTC